MSKYLNVQNGDYKVKVRDQGTITLDTGSTSTSSIGITNIGRLTPSNAIQITLTTIAGLQEGSLVTINGTTINDGSSNPIDNINGDYYISFVTGTIVALYQDSALLIPLTKADPFFPEQTGTVNTINGKVVVTGNLEVWGEQTIVSTTDLSIEDNIIVLNRNESGAGVSGAGISGIEIARGSFLNARWIWDDNVPWTDPANGGTIDTGLWSPQDVNGRIVGIQTVSIATNGEDLNLIGQTGSGGSNGVVSVYGTNNYEANVTQDDHIPNKKYVDDGIAAYFLSNYTFRIEDGTTTTSYVEVRDSERTTVDSKVVIGLDNNEVMSINATYTDIEDIRIEDNTIGSINEFDDLILQSNGTGSVKINDNLLLDPTPHLAFNGVDPTIVDPVAPAEGVKMYSKTQGPGATNIYYVNETGRADELISKNRALLYGMLF